MNNSFFSSVSHPETGLPQPYRIQEISRQNERTISLYLEGAPMNATPGQFVMVWLPETGEKPFSISGNDPVRLTIVDVGTVSHALHQLMVGDRVWLRGPLGHGYQIRPHQKAVLAGGGYGAAPLLFLGKELVSAGCDVQLWLGARSRKDLILLEEMQSAGVHVHPCTDDGSYGFNGLVTEGMRNVLEQGDVEMVYACGPSRMLLAVAGLCEENHISCQLSWEALMRCGMGLCGSCELDPSYGEPEGWLVCMDGPVAIRNACTF